MSDRKHWIKGDEMRYSYECPGEGFVLRQEVTRQKHEKKLT
jgi:hypothetical protein